MTSPLSDPSLRADALRNRQKLLAAAEALFRERGASASLDDVARLAKVGIGTLYRRFPTREALLAAMCDDRLLAIARNSQARSDAAGPMAALRVLIEELAATTNVYRGLAATIGTVLRHPTLGCAATTGECARLLKRAQAVGDVRGDLSVDDLICVVGAAATASDGAVDAASSTAHVVDLFFTGIETKDHRRSRLMPQSITHSHRASVGQAAPD